MRWRKHLKMMKVRITGRQPEMRKELDEEVDQMEFFVEVAKGNSYQVKGKSVGVDILT